MLQAGGAPLRLIYSLRCIPELADFQYGCQAAWEPNWCHAKRFTGYFEASSKQLLSYAENHHAHPCDQEQLKHGAPNQDEVAKADVGLSLKRVQASD